MSNDIHFVAQFVDTFPTPMQPSVLYISIKYSTGSHLCPCGCGNGVVTKLSPARWRITFDGEISLHPSVHASGLPCRSHYFIVRGRVDWQRRLSPAQARAAQQRDARALEKERLVRPNTRSYPGEPTTPNLT